MDKGESGGIRGVGLYISEYEWVSGSFVKRGERRGEEGMLTW
jgi:hypothetical protein